MINTKSAPPALKINNNGLIRTEYVCTSSPRVNSGVVLIVQVWLIQVAKGLNLQFSILEEVQLGEEGQPHEPQLE